MYVYVIYIYNIHIFSTSFFYISLDRHKRQNIQSKASKSYKNHIRKDERVIQIWTIKENEIFQVNKYNQLKKHKLK